MAVSRKSASSVALAAALLSIASACAQSDQVRTQRFLERGDRYARGGDDKSAVLEYRNAIKAAPASVDAHVRLVEASARLHDAATAAAELLTVAKLQPNDVAAQVRAGDAALSVGRLAEARLAFERAIAIDPDQFESNRALAMIYTAAGDHHLAERYWEVLARHPKGDPFSLADYYVSRGRLSDADRALRTLSEVPERAAAAQLRLASVLRQRRMNREANAMLDAVQRRDRRQTATWLLRARFRLADHQFADAADAYKRALAMEPMSPMSTTAIEALAGLTAIDLQEKRNAAAIERLERALARAPDAVPILMLSARAYVSTGAPNLAERALLHAIDVAPDALDAYVWLGQIYLSQNRLDAARARFEMIAGRAADPVPAQTMAAMILHAEQRSADAQARYEEILKAHPSAGVAANNLAWMYLEQGRLDDALRYALVAKQSIPRLAQVNDTLGWVYVQKGQLQDAIPLLAASAEAQPENQLYQQHLAAAYQKAGIVQRGR